MDIRLLLFLLVFSFVISETNAQTVKWLVAELRSFHIVPSCLNEGICREPQFRSILTVNGGRLSSAIGLNQTAVDGIYDRLVFNPLQQVDLKDFQVSAEVVGTDPSFHFPRVCDSGRVERLVANNTHNENESLFRVLLTGRCFQTTLFVRVYYKHCPWCLFDASSIVTNEERVTTSISTTLLLAGFCVASGATTILLLTICTFYYKSNRELRRKLKRSDTASSPSTQITESHYDLPWKTYGYRNLRLVRGPYESAPQADELIRLSPNNPAHPDGSFAICLGTTHRSSNEAHEYTLCKSFESSGRGSV